jgi:tetratricopeptide (TPR) repeat protein
MPLLDQAVNVARLLLNEPGLRTGPIAFVCHSLGGLIIKQVLRDAKEQQQNDTALADILKRTHQVVFLATPHTGSGKATLIQRAGFLAWGSDSAKDLVANKPELRSLNVGYRMLAEERRDQLRNHVYYEMADTLLGRIVPPDSSDPGLPNCKPVPIREDHVTICKPRGRHELIYVEVESVVSDLAAEPATPGALRTYPLPAFDIEFSWKQLVPKLVRVAALVLAGLAIWQGVPRLVNAIVDRSTHRVEEKVDSGFKEVSVRLTRIDVAILEAQGKSVSHEEVARSAKKIEAILIDLNRSADEKAEQAIEAARNDDKSAAERLYTELRDEQLRAGAAANKRAAEASRKIADLNRLSNVAEAARNYELATQLDPSNLENWLDLGDMAIATSNLAKALDSYRAALAIAERLANADPGDTDGQSDLRRSHTGIGDVLVAQGTLPAALDAYKTGLAIAERLANADPGDTDGQHDLSLLHNRIGDVLVDQGDLPAALDAYKAGLAIADRLAKADPGDAGWQRDLSWSHDEIGNVLVAQGNLPAALEAYRASFAIRSRLAEADPGNAERQSDLSSSHSSIGDVYFAQGNLSAAVEQYQASLHRMIPIRDRDSTNTELQRFTSVSHNRIGDFLVAQGNLPAALDAYRAGLAIADRLAKVDPGNAGWQYDLSFSHRKIGTVQKQQGRLARAGESFEISRAILASLTIKDPGNTSWAWDYAAAFQYGADVLKDQGKLDQALSFYREFEQRMAALTRACRQLS